MSPDNELFVTMPQLGKMLVLLGVGIAGVGLLIMLMSHLNLSKFGKLPGDIYVKRGNFTFYFPIVTSILLSLLLTLIFSLFSRK